MKRPDSWREVFPDLEALTAADRAEHGNVDEYRISQVPETEAFILYGIVEATKTIRLVKIRTFHGPPN